MPATLLSAWATLSIGSSPATPWASLWCYCMADQVRDRRLGIDGCSIRQGIASSSSISVTVGKACRTLASHGSTSRPIQRIICWRTSSDFGLNSASTGGLSGADHGGQHLALRTPKSTPNRSASYFCQAWCPPAVPTSNGLLEQWAEYSPNNGGRSEITFHRDRWDGNLT